MKACLSFAAIALLLSVSAPSASAAKVILKDSFLDPILPDKSVVAQPGELQQFAEEDLNFEILDVIKNLDRVYQIHNGSTGGGTASASVDHTNGSVGFDYLGGPSGTKGTGTLAYILGIKTDLSFHRQVVIETKYKEVPINLTDITAQLIDESFAEATAQLKPDPGDPLTVRGTIDLDDFPAFSAENLKAIALKTELTSQSDAMVSLDSVTFLVPEPGALSLFSLGSALLAFWCGTSRATGKAVWKDFRVYAKLIFMQRDPL